MNNFKEKNFYLLLITSLLIYFVTLKFHYLYEENITPFGDPFTYSIGFFKIIDLYEAKGYFSTLWRIITDHPNWYWLQNILVAILSPFLSKSMASISLMNYFIYFLASLSFYHLSVKYGLNKNLSIIGGLLPWVYPINYGFLTYAAITVTGLDASFTASLYIAVAFLFLFLLEPTNKKYVFLSAITAAIAIMGRGNSLHVVGLILFVPGIFLLRKSLHDKSIRFNLTLSLILFLMPVVYFYSNTYEAISSYYTNHLTFFTRHEWNFSDASKWLLNIPGYLFWQKENSYLAITLTIFIHFTQIYIAALLFLKKDFSNEKILLITGVFIYFTTYFVNITLFTDPLYSLQNCILQYQTMFIGFSCSILGLLIRYTRNMKIEKNSKLNFILIFIVVWIAYTFTKYQTPLNWAKDRPSPKQVEFFSINIDKNYDNNGKIGFLWYGMYNPQIINYFRVKNSIGKIKRNLYENPIYMGEFYNNIWTQSDYSEENREKVKIEIKDQFENADLLVIPKDLTYLNYMPYAFCYYNEDIADFMKSEEFPKMVIVDIVEDNPERKILILKKFDKLYDNEKYIQEFDVDTYLQNFESRNKTNS